MRGHKNIYIFKEDYLELHIFSKVYGEKIALCDVEDYDKISKIHWNVEFDGCNLYVRNRKLNLKLHRLIMNTPKDLIVDHINHNTLDNRKNNLRNCTSSDNNRNRPLTINYPHSTPEYGIGIWRKKYKDKYYSFYKVQIYGYKVKCFKDFDKAKEYRDMILKEKEQNNKEVL